MKTALVLAVLIVTVSSLPLVARRGNTDAPASPSPAAQLQARAVVVELLGGLDAGAARPGDTVLATTEGDARTPDGTLLPKGTRLIGHVREVRAQNSAHDDSSMSIAFDLADLVSGQRMRIHSVIDAITPGRSWHRAQDRSNAASLAAPPLGKETASALGRAAQDGAAAHETAIPGVLLAGASGTLSSFGGNVALASGTHLILRLSDAD